MGAALLVAGLCLCIAADRAVDARPGGDERQADAQAVGGSVVGDADVGDSALRAGGQADKPDASGRAATGASEVSAEAVGSEQQEYEQALGLMGDKSSMGIVSGAPVWFADELGGVPDDALYVGGSADGRMVCMVVPGSAQAAMERVADRACERGWEQAAGDGQTTRCFSKSDGARTWMCVQTTASGESACVVVTVR